LDALDRDSALQDLLSANFDRLAQQQSGMLGLLLGFDERLVSINRTIDQGAQQVDRKSDAILDELREMKFVLQMSGSRQDVTVGLSLDEVYQDVIDCNRIALDEANAGDHGAAQKQLARGRELAEAGLRRMPGDLSLVVALGYIEKTQAAIDSPLHPDRAAGALSRAAECFVTGLKSRSDDVRVSALNGMANVYKLSGDYDRAIEFGEILLQTAPEYGFAIFDYALVLEEKLEETGPNSQVLEKLAVLFERLKVLAAKPEQRFSASSFAYILRRAVEVNSLLAIRSSAPQ
jgi:tetratricopeptide (TPR) repeat protein